MGAKAVEKKYDDDIRRGQAADHHACTGKPGQAFIAERADHWTNPATALEPKRRRAIGPAEEQRDAGGQQNPFAQHSSNGQRNCRASESNPHRPQSRHAARWYRSVGLVDGVDMPVAPVIDDLAGAAYDGPGQRDADHKKYPIVENGNARGNDAAQECPHRWKPRYRLGKRDNVFQGRWACRLRGNHRV